LVKSNSVIIRVSNDFDLELKSLQKKLNEEIGLNLSKIDLTNFIAKELQKKKKKSKKFKMLK
jgi:hypothetical protein